MRNNPWKPLSLALTVALATSLLWPIRTAGAAAPTNLESALERLEAALGFLQKSTQDQGGHRVKAMAHTRQAIDEVKAGIAAAKRDKPSPAPTTQPPSPLDPRP